MRLGVLAESGGSRQTRVLAAEALHGVVLHVWPDFCYWAVCLLVMALALMPRTLGKAYSVLFVASASRSARRAAHARRLRHSSAA